VSNQDESSEQSKSLLRRLLGEDQEPRVPDEGGELQPPLPETTPDTLVSPIPGHSPAGPPEPDPPHVLVPTSPIRPTVQDDSEPKEPLAPSLTDKTTPAPLTPRERIQRAEEALINLRQKMANLAAEFAQGKLNRAQFDAIYTRYSEQRDIVERLLARNPDSMAWQSVVRVGHTTFLRQHYEAHVISYAIYDQELSAQVTVSGTVQLEQTQIEAVLNRLKTILKERCNPGPAQKKIDDGRCVLFVPGALTIAVIVFSREPSAAQVRRVQDIHHDFERANHHALRLHDYTVERLVFPHRALFEEKK
jgi:hypothetical protein